MACSSEIAVPWWLPRWARVSLIPSKSRSAGQSALVEEQQRSRDKRRTSESDDYRQPGTPFDLLLAFGRKGAPPDPPGVPGLGRAAAKASASTVRSLSAPSPGRVGGGAQALFCTAVRSDLQLSYSITSE